ncbi:MAG: hypothetical protein IJP86_02865 [Synergistaceae bacterium]|nr:hypothetical protein [Synergistaceae bacterium]
MAGEKRVRITEAGLHLARKKLLVALLMLPFVFAPAFAAESEDSLPDFVFTPKAETQEEKASSDILPDFDSTPKVEYKLPNPGNFFGEAKTKPDTADFSFRGKIFDCYVYKHMVNRETQLKQYRDELESKGFSSYPDEISGESALVIVNGEKTAYLFMDYKGKGYFMFMLEKGFEMEKAVVRAVTLDKGDVILNLNGSVYEYENKSMSNALHTTWVYTPVFGGISLTGGMSIRETKIITTGEGDIEFALPRDIKTGYHERFSAQSEAGSIKLLLFGTLYFGEETVEGDPYDFRDNRTYNTNLMKGKTDYLSIKVIYRDDREIRGSMEGTFEDGKTKAKVDFWLPIR